MVSQYWIVVKIPVRSQASSKTTTAPTATSVSTVYSGIVDLPGRLAPAVAVEHGANRLVRQQTTDRDHHEKSKFLQRQRRRQLNSGDESDVVGPVLAVNSNQIPDREDHHYGQHRQNKRKRPTVYPSAQYEFKRQRDQQARAEQRQILQVVDLGTFLIRSRSGPHPIQQSADSLRAEDLAEFGLFLLAETAGDQLRMDADESLADSVHRSA